MPQPYRRRPSAPVWRRRVLWAYLGPLACPAVTEKLRMLTIHAHPDDEASKGAATVAKLAAEGIESTLLCCTGGEEGDILNPAMNRADVADQLAAVRMIELGRSTQIIGYHGVELLGYRDSGMAGTPPNDDPTCFHQATDEDAIRAVVRVIRRVRPQVVVTYGPDQKAYGHPDHLKVYEISQPAFDKAADPDWFPEDGEPWTVSKMYYVVWYLKRMVALHEAVLERGLASPFAGEWFERRQEFDGDDQITTFVDVEGHWEVRRAALLAHATQVDPEEKFWFGIPEDLERSILPVETYVLAASRIPVETPETDLFAGLR